MPRKSESSSENSDYYESSEEELEDSREDLESSQDENDISQSVDSEEDQQKSSINSSSVESEENKPKPESKKKCAKNPYITFSNKHRPILKKKHPDWKVTDISKELGKMWRNLSESQKKKYSC
jgi:hypothetical protein